MRSCAGAGPGPGRVRTDHDPPFEAGRPGVGWESTPVPGPAPSRCPSRRGPPARGGAHAPADAAPSRRRNARDNEKVRTRELSSDAAPPAARCAPPLPPPRRRAIGSQCARPGRAPPLHALGRARWTGRRACAKRLVCVWCVCVCVCVCARARACAAMPSCSDSESFVRCTCRTWEGGAGCEAGLFCTLTRLL